MSDEDRCQAIVYRKDTWRVDRSRDSRGRMRHFSMHYTRDQCLRKAKHSGLCDQHARLLDLGAAVPRDG